MKYFLLAMTGLILAMSASSQRGGSSERMTIYLPAASATAVPGVEYRHDSIKMGRIFVSPELLAGLPFPVMMEEQRGGMTRTVPAIRADVSIAGATYDLTAYSHGDNMSFQSALQAYRERTAVMEAVDSAVTSGTPITITLVSLQSGETKTVHDGIFAAQ